MKYSPRTVFKIGFWHPFGVAAGESRNSIISRKKQEIEKNGWTLWSFQSRTDQSRTEETFECWINEIKKYSNRIFVFCSDSPNARDPKGKVSNAKQFKFANSNKWKNIPSVIKVPHPFGKRPLACSFKVKAIFDPEMIKIPKGIKWLCMDGRWREDGLPIKDGYSLPTNREFLIKAGGNCRLRKIYRVLELAPPYLAIIKK